MAEEILTPAEVLDPPAEPAKPTAAESLVKKARGTRPYVRKGPISEAEKEMRRRNLRPPWQKGTSGNPNGLMYKSRVISDSALRRMIAAIPDEYAEKLNLPKGISYADAMHKIMALKGLKGDVRAAEYFRDTIEGRPGTRLEIVGDGGAPVEVKIGVTETLQTIRQIYGLGEVTETRQSSTIVSVSKKVDKRQKPSKNRRKGAKNRLLVR